MIFANSATPEFNIKWFTGFLKKCYSAVIQRIYNLYIRINLFWLSYTPNDMSSIFIWDPMATDLKRSNKFQITNIIVFD